MSKTTSTKVTGNLIWRLMERFGTQIITFVVSILLARLLDPLVYGTVALVTVFSSILNVFVDSGLGVALVQKKDADKVDFSTVFYFNIVMCAAMYAIIFFCAPLIARFYGEPELTPIVRVLSLSLVISGVKNIQVSYVSKTMQFKRFFWSTLGSTLSSAAVGIGLAYAGFGVWALVAQTLVSEGASTIILWFTVRWKPTKDFSFKRLKGLFSYGWKLLTASLIDTVYGKIHSLVIGKKYTAENLAYYNRGESLPSMVVANINSSMNSVLMPAMAESQDEKGRVKAMTRRTIKTNLYLISPLMVGLGVCAEPVVLLLLTEKWLPCVFFMRIFCFTYAMYPIHTANLNAIKAMGRSDYFLWLEIIKKAVGISAILATMWISVEAMAWSLLVTTILGTIINAFPNKKLLNYSWFEQMKDILPYLGLSAVMGVPVFFLSYLPIPTIAILVIQVLTGAAIYIGLSALFKLEIFNYVLDTLKKLRRKKKVQSGDAVTVEAAMASDLSDATVKQIAEEGEPFELATAKECVDCEKSDGDPESSTQ